MSAPYNAKQIAWEIERTAMGDGYWGNALYVAKGLPSANAEDRALLDRYLTGAQTGRDRFALQDLAIKIYYSDDTQE